MLSIKYDKLQFTSSDYPAIFAIFAGIIIILSIAVLFIAVGIWNMDPGKDSIIYRMTTTRMKKD
uniref:Col_cuticle_N domain-containing protein n=1 Tax=Ascaris lumbricoides TaxID=6252 RepID=A0A0M3IWC6_ASCLU